MMRNNIGILLVFVFFAHEVRAEQIEWRTLDDTKLLTHACSYATSDAKKATARLALNELKRRGPEGMRALINHMHIKNIYIRVTADNWARGGEDLTLIPPIMDGLDSPHERTRSLSAYLLGYYELPEHADQIFPLLDHDKTDQNAIRTLGKWKVRAATPKILPYLQHEEERYRIYAANALRDIAEPDTIDALLPLLSDRYFTVRYVAARALQTIGEVEPLKAAMDGLDETARRHLKLVIKALDTEIE